MAYAETYQQYIATLLAKKAAAANAINGSAGASSDGLTALLGSEDEDLQTMLLKSIKGGKLDGLAEDWISEASERSKELLANLGNTNLVQKRLDKLAEKQAREEALQADVIEVDYDAEHDLYASNNDSNNTNEDSEDEESLTVEEAEELVNYFTVSKAVDEIVENVITAAELNERIEQLATDTTKSKKRKKISNKKVSEDQLIFDLFAV